ncbi:unnamed protein product [Discula destructiva]
MGGYAGSVFHNVFARSCVECQDGSPSCPSCADDEVCQVSVPLDCSQCPQAYCTVSSTSSSTSTSSSSKSSVGAIAGGVIGGAVLLALVAAGVYLVWKHKVKAKREFAQDGWSGQYTDSQHEKGLQSRRMTAATGATSQGRNSIASTVLTRASNIIQIAYIPGVTNRAAPNSPGLLVPPVPPIPSMSQAGTPNSTDDQHFFVPGDLRDSVCSGVSGYTDRTSFARTSYAPRSSVASTIYGKAGVVVTPAQTGMRAKAAMVSVKSIPSNNSSEGLAAPPVPAIDHRKYMNMEPPSPADSNFSVGSTFLNNASNAKPATAVRAQLVRVGSNLNPSTRSSPGSTSSNASDEPGPHTPTTSAPREEQSPFRDPPASRRSSNQTLSAVIQEATKRASQRPGTADRAKSPFDDEHATDGRTT